MGGEVGVASTPGQGSTFWLTARLSRRRVAGLAASHVPGMAERQLQELHAGRRVLLAEDEPVNCEITCILLQMAGLQVDVARDGLEAQTMAEQNRYELILMDMQMPQVDGLEATRRIRQMPHGQRRAYPRAHGQRLRRRQGPVPGRWHERFRLQAHAVRKAV
jgi:CheY-like chemotaxis protein